MIARSRPVINVTQGLIAAAAAVIVLAGVRVASPVLDPVLMALYFGLLLLPVYESLQRRGMRAGLALGVIALGLVAGLAALGAFLLVASIQLVHDLALYQARLEAQVLAASRLLQGAGLGDLSAVVRSLDPGRALDWVTRLLAGAGHAVADTLVGLFILIFFLAESRLLALRFRTGLGAGHPMVQRVELFGEQVVRYFWLRTRINVVMALAAGLILWLLGVDLFVLWAVLLFFLSYVPVVGFLMAMLPPALLAFAEFGPGRAAVVVALFLGVHVFVENVVQPALLGKELHISPTLGFTMFAFWAWLLGPTGALLSLPITLGLTYVLDTSSETRWLAGLIGGGLVDAGAGDGPGAVDDSLAVDASEVPDGADGVYRGRAGTGKNSDAA